jgi:hypothetical protein
MIENKVHIISDINTEIAKIEEDINSRNYFGRLKEYNLKIKEQLIEKQNGLRLALEIVNRNM